MTYAVAAALQQAVYRALSEDQQLREHVGDAIYDVVPSGQIPSVYVSLGPEDVRDRSDKTGRGARHDFVVSVVTDAAGFQTAKRAAGAVADALLAARLDLSRGRVVALDFRRARALRIEEGRMRRIDISFRAQIQDD